MEKSQKPLKIWKNYLGVGHKTASVVMSQGFGFPAFPIDTHIHRLAQRWGLTNGKNVVQTEKDLKRLFPKKYWKQITPSNNLLWTGVLQSKRVLWNYL